VRIRQIHIIACLLTLEFQFEIDGVFIGTNTVSSPLSNLRYIKIDSTDAEIHALDFVAGGEK